MGEIDGPFLGSEALASGLMTRGGLHREYRAVFRDVYLANDRELTPVVKAQAAWLWSGRRAPVIGMSAAALHGTSWIDASLPAEINRLSGKGVKGIMVHRYELADDETRVVAGIPTTTAARTAFDLGRRPGRRRALIRLDALARATGIGPSDISAVADRHRGARGLVQLRSILDLVDTGAESPQETLTRLTLIDSGLPRPRTQIVVRDEFGWFVARVDMGWDDVMVGVEFDGAQHWTDPRQRSRDIDRLAELKALGWRIVRVSGEMLRARPHVFLERVATALREAGAERPLGTREYSRIAS